jgi:phage terminase large subunit
MIQFPDKLKVLFQPARYKTLYGGRGGAKSWGIARALLIQGAAAPLRILCCREVQKSIDDSVHQLLADQVSALGLDSFYEVQRQDIIGKNGTSFLFAGLRDQNVTSIKSYEGIDRCWVEEAQAVTKRSWSILIPTIRKEDSEIWVSLNPELDSDETYQRFVVNPPPGSLVVNINYRDNPWFPKVLNIEREHLQKTDPEAYENVWEGKPRTVVPGAIYKREVIELIEGRRVRAVPYDPMLKVHAVWDLGWNDQMSIILVQRLHSELRIIEYIEDSHRTLADYAADLRNKPYQWANDWLPHDGAAKDYKTGKSAQELLTALGRRVRMVHKMDVESGIKAARLVLPRCYFDQDKTARLVDCLKRYRRAINATTQEPGAPLHDEHSHGADAFRYLSVVADKLTNDGDKMAPINYPDNGVR